MNEDTKLIAADQPEETRLALTEDSLLALAETAERRADAMHKIKRVALKLTNASDWVNEGGKPYLQASGAEKIARMFGISWRIESPERINEEAGHYSYSYKGIFSLAGASIEAIGIRSSNDPFFTTRYSKDRVKLTLPATQVDRANVQKSAYTNLLANGITRIMGLRNLTWDDLAQFANIHQGATTGVERKRRPSPTEPPPPESTSNERITHTTSRAIDQALQQLAYTTITTKLKHLNTILGSDPPITKMGELTVEQGEALLAALAFEVNEKETT